MGKANINWFDGIGNEYKTIEAKDISGERVWIKFEPKNPNVPVQVINILDKPEGVSWQIKESHTEIIYPNGDKADYDYVLSAGSASTATGNLTFCISEGTKLITFPIEVNNTRGAKITHISETSGTRVDVSIGCAGWIGYAVLNGNIKKISET